ncbi:conserved hypothetical protein [Tenacibaculum maritimum]|nr:conserved hypothetical protein [Tenacibaculum maritimum]CAA0250032.1 conserved hypothetical protein [Tenacibaculum maritimum]
MGQTNEKSANKAQTNVEVFYSEESKVFYLKTEHSRTLQNQFKSLITCSKDFFNEFLKYLGQFMNPNEPLSYSFKEMEENLNTFLIN